MKKIDLPIITLIITETIFGLNFIASKIIVKNINPFIWVQFRLLISFIFLSILYLSTTRNKVILKPDFYIKAFIFSLLAFVIGQNLFMKGLYYTKAINASIIASTIPMWVFILATITKKEKFYIKKFIGFLTAILSVAFLIQYSRFTFSKDLFVGDMLILLSSISIASFLVFGKSFVERYDKMLVTIFMFGFAFLICFIFTYQEIANLKPFLITKELVFAIFYSIVFATIIAYFLNNWALSKVPSTIVAILIYLQPIIATIASLILLKEKINLVTILSILGIIIGQIIVIKYSSKEKIKNINSEL